MLSFSPGDVLDEILNIFESVSEGFPTFSLKLFLTIVSVLSLFGLSFLYIVYFYHSMKVT